MIQSLCAVMVLLAMPAIVAAGARMTGESLVLAGNEPAKLLYSRIRPASVTIRSTYLPDERSTIRYERGRDYTVDAAAGTIARTPDSRIPDFSTNVLYGQRDFDHSNFPGYGNLPFTVYVDYESNAPAIALTTPIDAQQTLRKTAEKLRAGAALKIIAYGDSITAGGDASSAELQLPSRYAEHLRQLFPKATITLENGATGGDNTEQGLARLEEKVLSRRPDLVLIGFGMNDHNLPGVGGVEIVRFRENLRAIITRIRETTGSEIILLSTFPPHPQWHFATHRMHDYAAATAAVADDLNVAFADVHALWMKVLTRKDPQSLLGNNINHPNDFGHWLYLEALKSLTF